MAKFRQVVEARSRASIEKEAAKIRSELGLDPFDQVDMARLVDLHLPKMIDGYECRVAENNVLGAAEAVTDLLRPIITFSLKIYDQLCAGNRRARMTAAHELGHLLLHTRRPVGVAFMQKDDPTVDPERQADAFAAAFLMPEEAFRKMKSIHQAMKVFGVSQDAATCRARKLRMNWLVHGRMPPKQKTKGRKSVTRAP